MKSLEIRLKNAVLDVIEYRLLYNEFLRLCTSSDIEGTKKNFFRHFTPD